MFLIAGLGNPETQFFNTRHNVGFDFIDAFSVMHKINISDKKFDGIYGTGIINNEKVILMKPLTYMNSSGRCIRQVCNFYKIPSDKVIIVFDDISLNMGRLRVRSKGSAGGHNGIKSIIAEIGTEDFPRVRIGIGPKPVHYDLADFVLSKFNKDERDIMDKITLKAAEAVESMISKGNEYAMNNYNGISVL